MASEPLSMVSLFGLASGGMGLSRVVALNRSDRYAMLSTLGRGGNDLDVHGSLLGRNVVNPESENKWIPNGMTILENCISLQIINSFFIVPRPAFRFHFSLDFSVFQDGHSVRSPFILQFS